jgi:hypothetical protein
MKIDWDACPAIERVPGKMSGRPVIRGTGARPSAAEKKRSDNANSHKWRECAWVLHAVFKCNMLHHIPV